MPDYARDGRAPKRTVLTSDLIDLWNGQFFLRRRVEVVLYKGRERRSGQDAGTVDLRLQDIGDFNSSSDSESSSSEDDDDAGDRQRYSVYSGGYGRADSQLAELQERKRVRRELRKAEKKRRRQEKKQRKKQREADKSYALYITYVPPER